MDNMSKYIDAGKLAKDLERLCDIVCQYSKKQRDVMCGACPLGDAFELLDNYPAADVVKRVHRRPRPSDNLVKVVRCKECEYREREQPGMVYCPNTVGGWVDEDWFCAGGEKE